METPDAYTKLTESFGEEMCFQFFRSEMLVKHFPQQSKHELIFRSPAGFERAHEWLVLTRPRVAGFDAPNDTVVRMKWI